MIIWFRAERILSNRIDVHFKLSFYLASRQCGWTNRRNTYRTTVQTKTAYDDTVPAVWTVQSIMRSGC
jgi:hypothetical protein